MSEEPQALAWRALMWAVDRLAETGERTATPAAGAELIRGEPVLAPDAPGPAPWQECEPPPAWHDAASLDHQRYRAWLDARPAGAPGSAVASGGPSFSVVVPAYRTSPWILERCIESVRAQSWPRWECCVCDDGSQDRALTRYLRSLAGGDERIKVTALAHNQGISAATNAAVALGTGEFVALLDHDDELTPGALAAVAAVLVANPEADVAYTDEDKLDGQGLPFGPRFKPDFSPDYLLTTPYMGHLLVVRRALMASLGGMRSKMDGSQDYDLMLRATEAARQVVHVPEVAYHWRIVPGSAAGDPTAKPWAYAASGRALTSALRRRGEDAELEAGPVLGMWNARRRLPPEVSVSVVVSALGDAHALRTCVDGLATVGSLPGNPAGAQLAEVLVAGPPRLELETGALLARLAQRPGVRVVEPTPQGAQAGSPGGPTASPRKVTGSPDGSTDPSGAANQAARLAQGELVLFVDSRVTPSPGGWMEAMAEHAVREGLGPVGARLVSPEGLVRHVGLVLGMLGLPAGPVLEGLPASDFGYLEAARVTRNWSAVSGACLMIRRRLFDELGGFDAAMGPWADVDLCLRAGALGQRSLVCAPAELVARLPPARAAGGREEARDRFLRRWGDLIRAGDPFFSPHLSRLRPECVITDDDEEERWNSLMWSPARS